MAKRDQKSILVRMPTTLKRRLAREVARRESTLNDVAVAILAAEFGVDVHAERPPRPAPRARPASSSSASPRAQAAARRGRARAPQQHEQRHRRDAHRAARHSTPRKEHDGPAQRQSERQGAHGRQGSRRDHRRRQLRQLAPPGRRVLQGRLAGRVRPGPDARRPRRLPRPRRRVHGRLRRRRRRRSARTSPTRSGPSRTTRSSSPTSRRPASPSRAG